MRRAIACLAGLTICLTSVLDVQPAHAEGVYECPGMPMRYSDGADDPYCRWIELSEQKLIRINPSPFAPERDVRRKEPEGPARPLSERAPVADADCALYREWQELNKPLSGNSPGELMRRQELDRYFKWRGGATPRCPN